MYIVIQKMRNKKQNRYGAYNMLKAIEFSYSINGSTKTQYGYAYSGERFDRPNKDAYKISVHKSFRENGRVKKKQWVICTMDYYSLVDSWPGECIRQDTLNSKLKQMSIGEAELWDLVYEKLQPIIDQVKSEFVQTEEFKTIQHHRAILDEYLRNKKEFEDKYGTDTYDYCFDIFGILRNAEYLNEVKAQYKSKQEYQQHSYNSQSQSNYSYEDFSSYFGSSRSTYTEEDKVLLKKITRALVKQFHPDRGGDPEVMKMVTRLKEDWGV